MRISEISSPELRPILHDQPTSHLLSLIEASVTQTEHLSPETPFPATISGDLRRYVSQIASLSPFPNDVSLHLWKLSFRLWNACVDLSNSASVKDSSQLAAVEDHVKLRHVAADLLSVAGNVAGVPSPEFKAALFYVKTGLLWHELKSFELASTCFEKATDLVSKIAVDEVTDAGERKLLLDLNIARSRTAWEVSDSNLAINFLNRSKTLLFGSAEHYKALANQFLSFGKVVLARNEVSEALKLMNEAMNLYEKGLNVVRTRTETVDLKGLHSRCLRFVAAVHLQGGEFDSVLKCVRVLREGGTDQHPSLSVLATKAWLGLGRYGEAEKELRRMVMNPGIPEGVWVSALEAYFEAAGSASAETTKGLFLGLLGRCHVSAGAALRLTYKVAGRGGCGSSSEAVRAKVVAELVADDRVLALFVGEAMAKERTAMHSVLWNCAANHFQSKDYATSAEMFEKSMLYVPHDMENKIVRAKGYRVLCLCHFGLSQLDRAQEYINEAEKLEPTIVSAFLKFKIHLQKLDHDSAIKQMQSMVTYLDFTPDFLSLAAHEAVACRALPVAVASLSNLLTFFSSGKNMPTTEVIVTRTIVSVLTQDPGNEHDILKYMRRAVSRASELGSDCFFGKGEVGRRERNWFAINSWNFGTRASKEMKHEMCAEFMRLASEFYSILIDGEEEGNSAMVCKSLILSVSAMIALEKQRQAPLQETEVKQAIVLLDKAGKLLAAIPAEGRVTEDQNEPIFSFIYTFSMYDLYGRLKNLAPQQLLLVKSFAASKNADPSHLFHIGLAASEGPRPNPEVATFALNSCLSAFLSSPSPDYGNIALVIRKLIAVTAVHTGDGDDDLVHGIYKQAYRIMVGLKEGEYPIKEGKWLAVTAWNRAALPQRLGQPGTGLKWMSIGLEIAGKVAGMETYRALMEEFLASRSEDSASLGDGMK